ncbi:NADH dehydrogenase [ubiquinone] 1 alpha subcomplex assembly factor 4 [Silurus meridionalis]|uniref:NADH dehydrogenase [ubiquinone] 1 alpha subcomplex assembly factor 4 n=1 Tax=Silurus meridionalis TaxID=175797 RepID=UPI001EECB3E1|nr:NADH dehydrogenase [ubiquinone] 1 alpha subcomplex assembly factor 4 [Silurus meridionalis]KAI5094476.1 NADH dehydrogenase [ubiquinone] 1 alpha subcomplex assembly factor 4 [Silurus meridionalis]
MGARVGRLYKNFNLEARAHREIGKSKPEAAPRHPVPINQNNSVPPVSEIQRKDDLLLNRLREIYVDSKDPQIPALAGLRRLQQVALRPLSPSLVPPGVCDVTEVPKGKMTIVEALTALNKHKLSPQEWPAERIAQELTLTHSDACALTHYFIPFNIKVIKVPRADHTDTHTLNDS